MKAVVSPHKAAEHTLQKCVEHKRPDHVVEFPDGRGRRADPCQGTLRDFRLW